MNEFFIKIYKGDFPNYIKILKEKLINETKTFVITANPEAFTYAEKEEEYKKILLSNKVSLVPDGVGLILAGKIINVPFKERIPGIEISIRLLELANAYRKSIYLFGSNKDVIEKTVEVVKKTYPNVIIKGYSDGYVKDKDAIFKKIIKLKPDIVLVALGMPLQEKLIYKYYDQFDKGIFVGVGGSFDVISGTKKRAPKIFRKLYIEWLYRILSEPKRIKRFYNNNIKFIIKIKKHKKDYMKDELK